MHKYFKFTGFAVVLIILWLGPEKVMLLNYKEEKLHIAIVAILAILLILNKMAPTAPNKIDPKTLNRFKRILLLKSQLKFQWHLLKQQIPFNCKTTQVQLVIADQDSGKDVLMQGYGKIDTEDMPFDIKWHYNSNSIICVISTCLFPGGKAQHNQELFRELKKFIQQRNRKIKISKVYLLVSIAKIMHNTTDKSMDAFNYTLSALSNNQDITPIKVILTKCDQIAGFLPYFEHHDSAVKNKNWQIEFKQLSEFDNAYDQLINTINQNLIARMHTEAQLYRRILIKDFPVQLEKLRQTITSNLQHLLNDNNWKISSLAFTSGTQDGKYTDLISQNIGMQASNNNLLITQQRYFCNQIFEIPQIYLKPSNNLFSETWFQALSILMIYIIITTGHQALWLQRFFDITTFTETAPKIILERNANIWQRWQLAHELKSWLQNNPIPENFGQNIWQKNLIDLDNRLAKVVMEDTANCQYNTFQCLQGKWLPFTNPKQLSMRLAWLNNHKHLFNNLNLKTNDFNTANSINIENQLNTPIPETDQSKITWLRELIHVLTNTPNSTLAKAQQIKRSTQLINILENMDNGAKAFAIVDTIDLTPHKLPSQLEKLEHEIVKKLCHKVADHINLVWQETVLKYYNNIKNRFPINTESQQDITIEELKRLFDMQSFFASYYLAPASKLGIISHDLESLLAAKNFLTDNNKFNLRFSFMAPNGLMSDISMAELNIAGSISRFEKNKPRMYQWPIKGNDDTVGIWLQNKAGKLYMSSRHGPWGIFRLISSAGNIQPGSQKAKLQLPIGEQKIDISIYFERSWADLSIKLPINIV